MRAKIILPNLIAVLIVGLGGYFYLRNDLRSKSKEKLQKQIEITNHLYTRSEGLHGFELLNDVRVQAMSKDVTDAFAPVESEPAEGETPEDFDKRIRREWFKKTVRAVEVYTELWKERTGKRPELIFLTDRNGVVIARNITANACPAGKKTSQIIPVVDKALDGQANYAIWSIDDSPFSSTNPDPAYCQLMNTGLLELAAAPVWYEDNIAGVLVLGFEISNGTAVKKSESVGVDVAILKKDDVYSSSFATDRARQGLEQQLKQEVVTQKINAVINSGKSSDVFELTVEDRPYLTKIVPFSNSDKEDRVVTLLMGSLDDAASELSSLKAILVLVGLAVLLVFIAGVLLGNHFLRPVMAIEEGLLKVINGEYQYRFDVKSAEVGGLSYRINQLIGVLTGEEEESEE